MVIGNSGEGSERKVESCGESFHLLREHRSCEQNMAMVVTPKTSEERVTAQQTKGEGCKVGNDAAEPCPRVLWQVALVSHETG